MKELTYRVLRELASGEFRSGEVLARKLGISRGSVWHSVRALERAGLRIYRVRGRGYRLHQALSLLDPTLIRRFLGQHGARYTVEVLASTVSTNTLALEHARSDGASGTVIAAEWQTAGRGRLGRPWHAAVAGALTFSVVWRFQHGIASLTGLSPAVGVALMRALHKLGVADAALKWPNDLVRRGCKLGGILIEMQGDALGPTCAVIGVGLNVRLSPAVRRHIDQPTTDLETACGRTVDRNEALGCILIELASVLEVFERAGFAALRAEWQRHHAWQDRMVTVTLPDGRKETGVAHGIDDRGALLVAASGGMRRYHSGEVSLRLVPADRTGIQA